MITKMSKYDFILYAASCGEFVDKLRELSLVDVTTSSWEADDSGRELLLKVESYSKAISEIEALDSEIQAESYGSGEEAFAAYCDITSQRAEHLSKIAALEKMVEDMVGWGEFSVEDIAKLSSDGIFLRFFITPLANYQSSIEEWSSRYTIELISESETISYFVVISTSGEEEILLDAQEVKTPAYSSCGAEAQCVKERESLEVLNGDFARVAASKELITSQLTELKAKLDKVKISSTATSAADGSLLIMEAWAEKSTSSQVDALLEEYPDVVYFKADPTPEDNTPVKLRNKLFPWTFELIGNMYALPKYGTMDFTPLFAPFYMLFFAICLGDAGYGAIIFAAGVFLKLCGGDSMKQASWLALFCGAATFVFGMLTNTLFGTSPLPFTVIDFQKSFFSVSMIIGFVHVMLAMIVNIYLTIKAFGVKYVGGQAGWFILLMASATAFALEQLGISGFEFDSIPFYIVAGVGAVLMFLFNSPGKNIFMNFGVGIWNTYNNLTGILGDILSYIRLFAIGLSGGVLGLVFNSLATGMTGLDKGFAGYEGNILSLIISLVGCVAILLIGHGINLFMSTISAFVHPMRLTFVEFFKNGGFEAATRSFQPLKEE
ncbi:MAG: V-type ATP synthase subunit I [Rikenellaceae bacterium]